MAFSCSNDNVEACFVTHNTTPGEKTIYRHDVDSNKQTLLKRLIQPSSLLHLASFAAVFWLFVQVVHLQSVLSRLRDDNATIAGLRGYGGDNIQPADTSIDHIPMATNGGSRARRQAGSNDDIGSSYNYDTVSDPEYCSGHPSIHVVGNQQDQLEHSTESWFTFHTSSDTGTLGRISHESLKFVHNQFIEILVPGYYFVYSQICYAGYGTNVIGHEVVVRPDCGDGNGFSILEARAVQVSPTHGQRQSSDSGYAGGVFYLAANERIGVRPLQTNTAYYTQDNGQGSYFGAFLLSVGSVMELDQSLRHCP